MASPLQQIVPTQQLTGAATMLYTSASGFYTQIVALNAVNVDTGSHVITLYIVPNGSTADVTTVTTNGYPLLPNENYNGSNEYGLVLGPNDALWGLADTGGVVNIAVSGLLNG